MTGWRELPLPVLDALPLGAHRLMALTDESLFEACGVRIAYTERAGGVSTGSFSSLNCGFQTGDDVRAVKQNHRTVLEAVGAEDASYAYLKQVHGTDIVHVCEKANSEEGTVESAGVGQAAKPSDGETSLQCSDEEGALRLGDQGADGFVVEQGNFAAMLFSADCPLVIIVAPSGRFALAHAGWRGAVAGIAGKAVRQLARCDGADPECFNVYIGPHICADCFEVGDEVVSRFEHALGGQCIPSDRHVDLSEAISIDLRRNGILSKRIAISSLCTKCCSDRYFSYRATEGCCGRQAAIAVRLRT